MGNTQKEATVPAPARLAALRASAPRITTRTLTAAHRVVRSAFGVIISAARVLWAGPLGRRLTRTVLPAAARGAAAARAAAARAGNAPASRAVASVALPAAAAGVSAVRSGVTRVTGTLPPRAKVPAAATAVLALAAAVTAILTAIGPAAALGPAGPAIAAAALHPAAATAPGHAVAGKPAADAIAAAPRRHVVAAPAMRHAAAGVPNAARHRRADAAPAVRRAAPAVRPAAPAVRHAAPAAPARRHHHHQQPVAALDNWHAITEAAAGHPGGGALAPAQRLLPAALAGGQAALPITPARAANAQLITGQALRLHMGIRSAVIAVATAMQESTLENLNYGDRDSLGLFQQRPSAGWGTPAEITNPVYAADAFLHALAGYQAAHPGWATQPLYAAAQGVQGSAFPYAYAQWESQAAHIVAQATRHLL
jgi:hypothetical protein